MTEWNTLIFAKTKIFILIHNESIISLQIIDIGMNRITRQLGEYIIWGKS